MALAVENATSASINGASSGTITVNTSGTNRVCYLIISAEQNSVSAAPNVTSVTSSHATWTKLFSTQQSMSGQFTALMDVEIWQAFPLTQLTTEVVTVNYSHATDGGTVCFLAISGSPNSVPPFIDPNTSLPAVDLKANTNTQCAITFSTTLADNVLVEWCVASNSGGSPAISSGFTSQVTINDHSPAVWDNEVSMATLIVSSSQSNVTKLMGDTNPNPDCVMILFAVTGDSTAALGQRAQVALVGF